MVNSKTDFQAACEAIEELIWEEYVDPLGMCQPIPDGIVDIDRYLAAPLKVLWILKEPYDEQVDGVPAGGGWRYRDYISQPNFYAHRNPREKTLLPLTHVTYALLNGFLRYEDMPKVKEKPAMMEVLQSAAFMNINKLPGLTKSDDQLIRKSYADHRKLLFQQLETIRPDVVIGGNTLQWFKRDLDFDNLLEHKTDSVEVLTRGSQIFIDAFHPAHQGRVLKEVYVNDIVSAVERLMVK